MTDYNKINRWYAEQLNAPYDEEDDEYFITIETQVAVPRPDFHYYPDTIPFDIRDPRCREICREKYAVNTIRNASDGLFCSWVHGMGEGKPKGETIEDAELACLVAIYEGK